MQNLTSFNESVDLYHDFNPIASSSQQCSSLQMNKTTENDNNKLKILNSHGEINDNKGVIQKKGSWEEYMCNTSSKNTQNYKDISYTQFKVRSSNEKWSMKPWQDAILDYDEFIHDYNIKSLKSQSKSLQVNDYIPFLAATIVGVDYSSEENRFMVSLMDPTGIIKAVFHKDVYNQYVQDLVKDSVVILRNFRLLPVFGTFINHCIVVGNNNLETIYSLKKISVKTSQEIKVFEESLMKQQEKNKKYKENKNTNCNKQSTSSNLVKENVNSNIVNQTDDKEPELLDDEFDIDFDLDFEDDNDFVNSFLPQKKAKTDLQSEPETNIVNNQINNVSLVKEESFLNCSSKNVEKPKTKFKFISKKKIEKADRNKSVCNDEEIVKNAFEGLDMTFLDEEF